MGNRYVGIRQGFKGSVIKPGDEIPSKPSAILTLKDSMHFFDNTLACLQQGKNAVDHKAQVPTDPTPISADKSQSENALPVSRRHFDHRIPAG